MYATLRVIIPPYACEERNVDGIRRKASPEFVMTVDRR